MASTLVQLTAPQSVDWKARVDAIAAHARVTSKTITKKYARQVTRGPINTVSKMPCKTYSLPTRACNVGSKLRSVPSSVCFNCYANKGCSVQYKKTVDASRENHLSAITHPDWAPAMVRQIQGEEYFRWHSAGDLQSFEHLVNIVAIAIALPETRFWLPTREYALLDRYKRTIGAFPRNLRIRASAPLVDGAAPTQITGYGSAVHSTPKPRKGYRACIAPLQGGECRDCRACWSPRIAVVSYHLH